MADIAFLLLIFFMLSSILEMEKEIPIDLPGSRITKSETGKFFNIWITPDGTLIYDGKPGSLESLVSYARYRRSGNSDMRALINADRNTPYRQINSVLEALKEAGLHRIVMVSRKDDTRGRL
jgi:biopolymer transport protein ExbD